MIVSTTKCPIINAKGETIGIVCIIRDITKQKNTEFELLKYNSILSEANSLLEERQQQIEQQSEELRTHAENLKEANDLLIDRQKLIEIQANQLKENNQQLSILNSTKDRFFSIIAHDLRNPFHVLSGFSEVLINDFDKIPVEKTKKYIKMIYDTSTNGKNLLENLLQWSRAETGKIAFNPEKLNLLYIVEGVIDFLEGNVQQKNIKIKQLIGPDIAVLADDNMLKTIFRNLVSNAIKFSLRDGCITLTATATNGQIEITVADTGVGIPPETLPLLFQIENTITTKGTSNEAGTGLGLILCKEFIEKHKGKIWVESTEGKGSKFIFTLPSA